MRLLRYFVLLLVVFLSSCSVKQQIKRADKKYEIGEYYKAAGIYRSAYPRVNVSKDRATKAYVAYRAADCYRLVNENDRAERYFSNAVRYKYKDSTVYLDYAEVLRKNKKPKDAIVNYDVYLQFQPNSLVAKNGKEAALQAVEWQKNPTRYKISKMDKLSSKKTESCPAHPGGDGDVVYFASSREVKGQARKKMSNITGVPNKDMYVARRNSLGEWDNIEPLEGELNSPDDEGSPSFSSDGKVMYFTRCRSVKGESLGAEIMSATRSGGKWGKPTKVELSKDSSVTFAHPTVSPDGKFLYFVSDMKGGFGGKDIWRSEINGGKYGAPVNLGPSINTSGDEMFPYMREDSTLFFSSDGLPGFGGLDIFFAKENQDNSWTVRNMMYPINSNADDFGITFAAGGKKGLFSSNREERKGYDKLWEFELPDVVFEITGRVVSTDGEGLADANVRVVGNDGTNVKLKTKKDGSFSYPLKKEVQYVLLGTCRGFLNQKEQVSTVGLEDSKSFPLQFNLASISKPVGLDNIFFEFGKASLTAESSGSLDKLVKLLKDNPNITIEIGAHTDRVGSADGNLALSGKRAQSVVDYLIKGGIDAERLTAKGYGKTQPVTVDKALAGKYEFLKENDVLDDAVIDALTPEQQEVANQINRRTEFRVLKTTYKMY